MTVPTWAEQAAAQTEAGNPMNQGVNVMNNYAAQNNSPIAQRGDAAMPDTSALQGIRRRIAEAEANVCDIHGIADRACGVSNAVESKTAPQAVPNGMLEEIENALDNLVSLSIAAASRLSRIA